MNRKMCNEKTPRKVIEGQHKLLLFTVRYIYIEFLEKAILRLYDNWRDGSFVCDDNLILRLSDDAEIKPEWFVNAEQLNY